MGANSSGAKKKNPKPTALFWFPPIPAITSLQDELVILRRPSYSVSHKEWLQGESTASFYLGCFSCPQNDASFLQCHKPCLTKIYYATYCNRISLHSLRHRQPETHSPHLPMEKEMRWGIRRRSRGQMEKQKAPAVHSSPGFCCRLFLWLFDL